MRRSKATNEPTQMDIGLPEKFTWGGAREGAGRKRMPKGKRRVEHDRRPELGRNQPVHVTWRLLPHVYNLRSRRGFTTILRALVPAAERFGVRITHFSVQGNHLHVIVEAGEGAAFTRAMKGLAIRVAKGLNELMGTAGAVFADRYHAHVLRSPPEVRNAIRYVLENSRVHAERQGKQVGRRPDAFAIAHDANRGPRAWWRKLIERGVPVAEPRGWLLNEGSSLRRA
jgi:REP element-mobilizing transposase RayT